MFLTNTYLIKNSSNILYRKFIILNSILFSKEKHMQHLNKQTDAVFARKWNFDQNWNNV